MILLRVPILIVDFLADQHQESSVPFPVIAFQSVHKDVVVSHNDNIYAGIESGFGNIFVRAASVRVACVHMQVDDNFVHGG